MMCRINRNKKKNNRLSPMPSYNIEQTKNKKKEMVKIKRKPHVRDSIDKIVSIDKHGVIRTQIAQCPPVCHLERRWFM